MEGQRLFRGIRAITAAIAISSSAAVIIPLEQPAVVYAEQSTGINSADIVIAEQFLAGRPAAVYSQAIVEISAKYKISPHLILIIAMFESGGGKGVGRNDGWLGLGKQYSDHIKEIEDVAILLSGQGSVTAYKDKNDLQKLQIFNGGSVGKWNSKEYRDNAENLLKKFNKQRDDLTLFFQIQEVSDETVGTEE